MLDSGLGGLPALTPSPLQQLYEEGTIPSPLFIDKATEGTDRLNDLLKVIQQPDGRHLPSLLLLLSWLTWTKSL